MVIDIPSIRKVLEMAGENPDLRPMVGMPFSLIDLHCAFAKVQDKRNWKLPIYATIEEFELSLVLAAIIFFTGGGIARHVRTATGQLEIVAHGYYYHVGS